MKSLVPGDTTKLGGNQRSTQSALIVPKPTCKGCEYLYYVYTTSEVRGNKQLSYSVVDMRENKGKGAIISKNNPVSASPVPSTERSTSVENKRDSTFWVITHDYNSNCFRVNHLTTSNNRQEQQFCLGQKQDTLTKAEGYIKLGPADTTAGKNGAERPMAVVVPGPPRNSIDLFTFNDSTGAIVYQRKIDLGPAPPRAFRRG